MIPEVLIAAFLMFAIGSYVGVEKGRELEQEKAMPARAPEVWPPASHTDLLKACSIACGENNLKEYVIVYGKCKCKG